MHRPGFIIVCLSSELAGARRGANRCILPINRLLVPHSFISRSASCYRISRTNLTSWHRPDEGRKCFVPFQSVCWNSLLLGYCIQDNRKRTAEVPGTVHVHYSRDSWCGCGAKTSFVRENLNLVWCTMYEFSRRLLFIAFQIRMRPINRSSK